MPDAQYWIEKMREDLEAGDAAKVLIKAPEIFKKDSDWCPWGETLLTYLWSKKGQNNGVLLAYIVREHTVVAPDMMFPTDMDEKIGWAILAGPQYAADNAIVYVLLKYWASNGPLWPFIQAYETTHNGRAAWKALVTYYEGDSMCQRIKAAAYQLILKANYQGPRRNFDFGTYVTAHQQAHQDLAHYGEPIPEFKKVQVFLDRITDPQCE